MTSRPPEKYDLPVADVLPALSAALGSERRAVLAAPPGAGKTTLVPLHLLGENWRGDGRIILIEPRRLAARAAARRMAELCGEEVGGIVGYRIRLDTCVSSRTRIEVVTEGVFVRMALDDPELAGVSAVIFDEFHERALDADFGLALALEIQNALRDDLRLLVMSATLDVARVAALLKGAPVIASEGRAFPVELRYREQPAGRRIEDAVASAVVDALHAETGSILAFLPGQAEIRQTAERLTDRLPADTLLAPLFGTMDARAQDEAIQPPPPGRRKVVLATSIAETSITIDGVRIVIDSGWQRLPRFEPSTGITRLETVRVSQASAAQRAGRAGRTEPGIAIRLWRAEQTAALPAFTPPEILASELSGLLLNCAAWGVDGPDRLALLDAPPAPAVREARALLNQLGALDAQGGLTPLGRRIQATGLPARLGTMVAAAETAGDRLAAAELAMLLTEQGLGGPGTDLAERRRSLLRDRQPRAKAALDMARRLAGGGRNPGNAADGDLGLAGRLLLKAYPDRVALRKGAAGRYLMANGRAALLEETDPLAQSRFLVVADLTGASSGHRILAAAALDEEDATAFAEIHGERRTDYEFDDVSRSVRVRETHRLGALVLGERALPPNDDALVAEALAQGLRRVGLGVLPWSKEAVQLRDRLAFLHRTLKDPWPDVSDDALLAALDQWFVPFQGGVRSLASIASRSLIDGLSALVPYELQRAIDREAPTHFTVPTGNRIAIRYDGPEPVLAVRVQELFGLTDHPTIAGARPLLLELLSPAHRPIQTTRDLPGFWRGSWADVRREMRGRYPRHPWPEDPASAAPTHRAKPRGE